MSKKKTVKEEVVNEKDLDLKNPDLKEEVDTETVVKNFLVSYTGEKTNPEDNQVSLEMIVETVAEEFPEFLLAVAEENWIRGYHQALHDVEHGEKLMQDEQE